jgi:hypothetical protein
VLTLVSSADSPSSPLRYAPALAADWNAGVASATLMHRLHGSPVRFPVELHLILDSQVTMALLIRVSFCTTSPWTSPSSWLLYLCVWLPDVCLEELCLLRFRGVSGHSYYKKSLHHLQFYFSWYIVSNFCY